MMQSSDSLFEEITRKFNPTMFEFYTVRAFIARTSEWTSSPFTKNLAYSFIYDKRKHSLLSNFGTKAWIMASRNLEMLSVHSCYVWNVVHEFLRLSGSLTIYLNELPLPLTCLCVLFWMSIRIFLPLRWIRNSWSGHCSGMKVPATLRYNTIMLLKISLSDRYLSYIPSIKRNHNLWLLLVLGIVKIGVHGPRFMFCTFTSQPTSLLFSVDLYLNLGW